MMASVFEGDTYNSSDILREIQTERMVYQINSSSNARKASDKMKRGVETVTKAMENARSAAIDRKKMLEEMRINLSEKKDKMRKLQQELEHTRKRIESLAKKTLDLETDAGKITTAMEKIKEASQEIGQKHLEQSQNDLMDLFVKVTSDAEKAQSDLNAAKRMESVTSKKLQEIEADYNRLEGETLDEEREVEAIMSNVSITTQHILKSYDDLIDAAKDLLKSAISTNKKYEDQNQTVGQNRGYGETSDAKVAV